MLLRITLLLTLIFLCPINLRAQETIYMANGTTFPFRLVEATSDNVKYAEPKGEATIKRSFRRENILIAFAKGRYLVISDISKESAAAQQQIEALYLPSTLQSDILIVATPFKVISATIQYTNDKIVNYKTTAGTAGSLSKNELVAILYKDGRHELIMAPEEAAPLLSSASIEIAKPNTPVSPPAALVKTEAVSATTTATKPASAPKEEPTVKKASSSGSSLNNEELKKYRTKSLLQVDEFAQYLDIIADKTIPSEEKDKAIEQALKLFLPEATIQVSSSSRTGARSYPIKDYLKRLKLLPYGSVKIEWSEVNYVSELAQAADGNYYGRISGTQTFTGYNASGKSVTYSDVTQKSVDVKLQSYSKSVDGQQSKDWGVLLGNIGVATDK